MGQLAPGSAPPSGQQALALRKNREFHLGNWVRTRYPPFQPDTFQALSVSEAYQGAHADTPKWSVSGLCLCSEPAHGWHSKGMASAHIFRH